MFARPPACGNAEHRYRQGSKDWVLASSSSDRWRPLNCHIDLPARSSSKHPQSAAVMKR